MRPKMDRQQRAKQFMPFAALKGYEDALQAKERIVVPRVELSEEMKEELDDNMKHIQKLDTVKVTFFSKGEYLESTGIVSRLDTTARVITIVNKKISFEDIYRIEKI